MPSARGYRLAPQVVGEHLRNRRLDLGLRQEDAALVLKVCKATLRNWETGRNQPEEHHYPTILSFLGYDPLPKGETLAERILATRTKQGITQEELARKLGLDPSTVSTWERGRARHPWPRLLRLFEEYVKE